MSWDTGGTLATVSSTWPPSQLTYADSHHGDVAGAAASEKRQLVSAVRRTDTAPAMHTRRLVTRLAVAKQMLIPRRSGRQRPAGSRFDDPSRYGWSMTARSAQADIRAFVSYPREMEAQAAVFWRERMDARGITIWSPVKLIQPGADWAEAVAEWIHNAELFVLVPVQGWRVGGSSTRRDRSLSPLGVTRTFGCRCTGCGRDPVRAPAPALHVVLLA